MRLRGDDLRLAVGEERGLLQPNVSWTHNDLIGEHGTYNVTVSLSHSDVLTDTVTQTTFTSLSSGAVDLAQWLYLHQHDDKDSFHLTSRLQWQLGQGDQITLQPFVVLNQGTTEMALHQSASANPPPYDTSQSNASADSGLGKLSLQLKKHLAQDTVLDLRGYVGWYRSSTDTLLNEFDQEAAPVQVQHTTATIHDRSWSLTGKLSQYLADKQHLLAGFETEGVQRVEENLILINGQPAIAGFSGDIQASTRRLAAYVQDEWDPTERWSASLGGRWEGIRTLSAAVGEPVNNNSSVLAPMAHAVWRFDPPARDQLRFSLTRSYRTPTLTNLVALPSVNTLYLPPGPNTASSPDTVGNPSLRPELATGIDLALEHYLGSGGIMSVSVFRRDIHDLIRNTTTLQTVPWATSPRWVAAPTNVGDAFAQGIELDAKFRLDEWWSDAVPVTVRTNVSVYGSSVSGVVGPYNRIDQQPRASANVGGDYRFRAYPLTLGTNFNWVPPYSVQETDLQSQSYQLVRVLDAYALWTFGPGARLRLSLSNLVPRDYVTSSNILAAGLSQTVTASGPTYRVATLRLEIKL